MTTPASVRGSLGAAVGARPWRQAEAGRLVYMTTAGKRLPGGRLPGERETRQSIRSAVLTAIVRSRAAKARGDAAAAGRWLALAQHHLDALLADMRQRT